MKDHALDIEIKDERRKNMTAIAKRILVSAEHEIAQRNKWIKAREEQKSAIEEIRREVYAAFDAADEEALAVLSIKLKQLVEMKKYSNGRLVSRPSAPEYNYEETDQ